MKLGFNDSARVHCTKSKHHGFHPVNELCPFCPSVFSEYVLRPPDWYMCLATGISWDANEWPTVRAPGYVSIASILPNSREAEIMCGCNKGQCKEMSNGIMILPVCILVKNSFDPEWKVV